MIWEKESDISQASIATLLHEQSCWYPASTTLCGLLRQQRRKGSGFPKCCLRKNSRDLKRRGWEVNAVMPLVPTETAARASPCCPLSPGPKPPDVEACCLSMAEAWRWLLRPSLGPRGSQGTCFLSHIYPCLRSPRVNRELIVLQ